jgi:hypothetical protein
LSVTQAGAVFENSAACVYVETSRRVSAFTGGGRREASPVDPDSFRDDFELKLLGDNKLVPSGATCFFTESLILAQDERWRRA